MRVLSNHGLVEADMSSQDWTESRGYSIHGCVHSWTVSVLNQEWDYDLARSAVSFVASHVSNDWNIRSSLMQRRLLQHANRCSYMFSNNLIMDDRMDWACYNLGLLYADQSKLLEAEQMFQKVLQGEEKTLGLEHILTLDTILSLGLLYADQSKFLEAEQMYAKALQGYEKVLSPENLSTLSTINNLGSLYIKQGKFAEAEQMYKRALQSKEKTLGLEHISTLDSVNNLGTLYNEQGKLVEAEQMYQRALQGYDKAIGINNTATYIPALSTIRNLSILFERQAGIAKAKTMYSKALIGYEKVFGSDHARAQELRNYLRALDAGTKNIVLVEVEDPVNNLQGVL